MSKMTILCMKLKLITEPQNNNGFYDQKTATGELKATDYLIGSLY